MNTKPIIGIAPNYSYEKKEYTLSEDYVLAIEKAGGCPIVLLPHQALPPFLDGLLLTGGGDIDPLLFGEEPLCQSGEINPLRDACEMRICEAALEKNLPMLGICRGMQMINVFFGGTLYLDLEEQFDGMCAADDIPVPAEGVQTQSGARVNHWQTKEYGHPTHTVSIMRSSKLGEILGCDSAAVNSMHHQGVRALPPNLAAATAWERKSST